MWIRDLGRFLGACPRFACQSAHCVVANYAVLTTAAVEADFEGHASLPADASISPEWRPPARSRRPRQLPTGANQLTAALAAR